MMKNILVGKRLTISTRLTHFCTFWLQSGNHEKRFWQASSGRKTQPRRRNQQTAAMQRGLGEVEKRRCTRHSALTGRVGTAPIQKIKSKNAGRSARVVQRVTKALRLLLTLSVVSSIGVFWDYSASTDFICSICAPALTRSSPLRIQKVNQISSNIFTCCSFSFKCFTT